MKKIYLNLIICFAANISFGQVLQSDDFNALTIGNIGTVFDGTAAGQGDWLTVAANGTAPTTSTNASNESFQIVASGVNGTNAVKVTTPNGDKGSVTLAKSGFQAAWDGRTAGNEILNVTFDFYTGPMTTSKSLHRFFALGLDGATARIINGFQFNTATMVLAGLATLNNSGAPGLFSITLLTGGLVLEENTWYTLGYSYNNTNGQPVWRVTSGDNVLVNNATMAATNFIGPYNPSDVRFIGFPPTPTAPATPNDAISEFIIDNYKSSADAEVTLNTTLVDKENLDLEIIVYPNPVADVLNVRVGNGYENVSFELVDLNGRTLFSGSTESINMASYNAGVYILNVLQDGAQVGSQKIIKK